MSSGTACRWRGTAISERCTRSPTTSLNEGRETIVELLAAASLRLQLHK